MFLVKGQAACIVLRDSKPHDIVRLIASVVESCAHQLRCDPGPVKCRGHVELPKLDRSARRDGRMGGTLQYQVANHATLSLSDVSPPVALIQQILEMAKVLRFTRCVSGHSYGSQHRCIGPQRHPNSCAVVHEA
jgi:hypothetical protein